MRCSHANFKLLFSVASDTFEKSFQTDDFEGLQSEAYDTCFGMVGVFLYISG
jgi:hypothetical protein